MRHVWFHFIGSFYSKFLSPPVLRGLIVSYQVKTRRNLKIIYYDLSFHFMWKFISKDVKWLGQSYRNSLLRFMNWTSGNLITSLTKMSNYPPNGKWCFKLTSKKIYVYYGWEFHLVSVWHVVEIVTKLKQTYEYQALWEEKKNQFSNQAGICNIAGNWPTNGRHCCF